MAYILDGSLSFLCREKTRSIALLIGGVNMKPEKTESQKIGDELRNEMETYGLYDKVKMDIYTKMIQANDFLYDIIDRDLPEGKKEIQYMKNGSRFVASIITLYILVKPKMKYLQDKKYKKLEDLDDYYFSRKNIAKMTFDDSKIYFDLLREFIEELGITRFEIEKLNLNEKVKRSGFESK
jgi:hypothetical protein